MDRWDASSRRDSLPVDSPAEHIMAMPATGAPQRRWTEEEFYSARDAAPAGERWELVDVRQHALGEAFPSPLDVKLEPGLVLQPDVLVVPAGELRRRSDVVRRLLLAVEILSPTSARHDRVTKRPRYQRNRVPEYWIVDDTSQTVERWTPDDARPELLAERLLWHPAGAPEAFVLDLVRFFADAAPEDEAAG